MVENQYKQFSSIIFAYSIFPFFKKIPRTDQLRKVRRGSEQSEWNLVVGEMFGFLVCNIRGEIGFQTVEKFFKECE